MDKIRINKYIASCGVCSRREAEEYVKEEKVKVNGQVVTDLATKVSNLDKVEVCGRIIKLEQNKIYLMLNKPKGYVTTSKEQFNRPCVLDLINENERIFPVGRLDMASEGMLLFTNDGEFMNKVIHPKTHIAKTYDVKLKEKISYEDILKLENGVDIGGYITNKAIVKKIGDRHIEITIYEGKNRQIRKMCETIGNKVVELKRISIGTLKLGNLKSGEYVRLTEREILKIFK